MQAGRTKMRSPLSWNLLVFLSLCSFLLPLSSLPFTPPKPSPPLSIAFAQPKAKQRGSNRAAPPLTEPGPAVLPDGAGAAGWEQLDVRGQTEPVRPLPLLAPAQNC